MAKVLLLLIFTLYFVIGHTQKKDTIRIHSYETGLHRFKLIIKKNTEFAFTDRYIFDTLKGKVVQENGKYSWFVDSNHLVKWQKRVYSELKNSLQLIWNKKAKALLLQVSFDASKQYYLDTAKISSLITEHILQVPALSAVQ